MKKELSVAMIGGSKLINLHKANHHIDILVNSPGTLFSHMEIVTNLSFENGYTYHNLIDFTKEFHITSQCGHIGVQEIEMEVFPSVFQPKIKLSIGPHGMYQNKISIHCKKGKTFTQIIGQYFKIKEEYELIMCLSLIESDGQHHQHH